MYCMNCSSTLYRNYGKKSEEYYYLKIISINYTTNWIKEFSGVPAFMVPLYNTIFYGRIIRIAKKMILAIKPVAINYIIHLKLTSNLKETTVEAYY